MRTLTEIAIDISRDWGIGYNNKWKQKYVHASPYLHAMMSLDKVTDMYGLDSGDMIVRYFLSNAKNWTGETARTIKKELNAMIK